MMGLAIMAARLAQQRKSKGRGYPSGIFRMDGSISMARRSYAERSRSVPCSREYYRIIDRISRGEKP